MKGSQLVGCTAIALAGMCGVAAADGAPGKFDIKLSGDAMFEAGLVHTDMQSDPSAGATIGSTAGDFVNQFRLMVNPSATADNGLQYGANLRVRAWLGTGGVDADQAYIYAVGPFGRLEAGVTPGANNQYATGAPSGFGTGGVLGDWSNGPNPNTATNAGYIWLNNQNTYITGSFGGEANPITGDNWSTKINYFTPRFLSDPGDKGSGVMGVFSYAPNNISINTGVTRSPFVAGTANNTSQSLFGYSTNATSSSLQGNAWSNMIEAGLRYDGTIGEVAWNGSFGYVHGQAPTPNTLGTANVYTFNDLNAYQVGLQFGWNDFLVGASYVNSGKSGYTKGTTATSGTNTNIVQQTGMSSVEAGIQYQDGAVIVGFNYAHGQDAGDMTLAGSRTADMYAVGVTYGIAQGLLTSLEYVRSETHNQAGFNSSSSADYMGNGTINNGNANLVLWKTVVNF